MPVKSPRNFIFSLVPAFVFFVGLEMFFQAFPYQKDSGHTASGFVVPDKDLIWRLAPFADGPLKTNELGFRDTAFNQLADIKILLLGDSITWGDGVRDPKQIFSFLLEKFLSEKDNRSYEVINTGVPGYSTFQQLRYLQLHGLKLEPDLIILQFCLNDVIERYHTVAEYGGNNIFLGVDTRESIEGFYGWLVRHSRSFEALIRFLMKLSRDQQAYQTTSLIKEDWSPEVKEAWELTISEIESIRQVALENNIPFLLTFIPFRLQIEASETKDKPQEMLRTYAAKYGLPVVDLLPSFVAKNKKTGLSLFTDHFHLSEAGHLLTAEVLLQPTFDLLTD